MGCWEKKKKHKKIKVDNPNILIPVGVAILTGCFAWYYFGNSTNLPNPNMTVETLAKEPLQNEDVIESLTGQSNNSVSFHLVGKGINMPNNLPDVFLDMDGFDN